jgi:hypothetical protein
MSDELKPGGEDPNEKYDAEKAKGKDHEAFELKEAGNKSPPSEVPFKITHSG